MTRYRIVPERSRVWITARSTLHAIHSEAGGLTGWVDLALDANGRVDLAAATAGRVELPVGQLRGGNALEERELKRRIDARRFPVISGDLTAMSAGGDAGSYAVHGDVSFRGVSRACEDLMTVERLDASTVRLQGASTFDVRDFGLEPPKLLMLKVEPEVDVRVDIIARSGDHG